LNIELQDTWEKAIKSVKEYLRTIPSGGTGFGVAA